MAFFSAASGFNILGGTFTNHVHGAEREPEKGAYSFVSSIQNLDHDTNYLTQGRISSPQEWSKGHYTTVLNNLIVPNVTHVLVRPF